LPSEHKALGLVPSSEKKKEKKKRNVEQLRQWEADVSEETVQLQNPLFLEQSGNS